MLVSARCGTSQAIATDQRWRALSGADVSPITQEEVQSLVANYQQLYKQN